MCWRNPHQKQQHNTLNMYTNIVNTEDDTHMKQKHTGHYYTQKAAVKLEPILLTTELESSIEQVMNTHKGAKVLTKGTWFAWVSFIVKAKKSNTIEGRILVSRPPPPRILS